MKPKPASIMEFDVQELEAKLCDIEQIMGEQVARPFRLLLAAYLSIMQIVQSKRASIGRLRRLLFGARTEKTRNVVPADAGNGQATDPRLPVDDGASSENSGVATANKPAGRRPNHGRTPASAYTGCERVIITHKCLTAGDGCPHCQEGTLYRLSAWGQVIRLIGQAPVGGCRYELERLRETRTRAVEKHAELVAQQFRDAGYRATSVDGKLDGAERAYRIGGLAEGRLDVLTSCDLISEGLDVPGISAAILLRPTKSLGLFLQQIGRSMRPKPDGSPAVILDRRRSSMTTPSRGLLTVATVPPSPSTTSASVVPAVTG